MVDSCLWTYVECWLIVAIVSLIATQLPKFLGNTLIEYWFISVLLTPTLERRTTIHGILVAILDQNIQMPKLRSKLSD